MIMKISFNKKLATVGSTGIVAEGRHIGTVVQIAALGNQPAFNPGESPDPSVGVVVQLTGTQLAKKMRISDSTFSTLFAYLDATLPDPDGFDGDDPLPLTLGRPVAIEVTVKGQYSNISSFHRPEVFELGSAPTVAPNDLLILDSPDALIGEAGKSLFLTLHRDIRSWLSRRVRSPS
jgi:hypothetical protein